MANGKLQDGMFGYIVAVVLIVVLSFGLVVRCASVEGFQKDDTVLITAYDGQKFSGKIVDIGVFEITLSYYDRAGVPVKRSEIRTIKKISDEYY